MGSYSAGKEYVCDWVRQNFPKESTILDVGACNGKWKHLLMEYNKMDAVEIFTPNMANLGDYRAAYNIDIKDYKFTWYDLIIFGDVIEHMEISDAQDVLAYARPRCRDMIVAVPYQYHQDEIYGNRWERHIQDDLTPDIFAERYPGFRVLCKPVEDYCYYVKDGTTRRIREWR